MKIIKRNGSEAVFDITKIIAAITKANHVVPESQRLTKEQIIEISDHVQTSCLSRGHAMNVEEIQDLVEDEIMQTGAFEVARKYITYRYVQSLKRTPQHDGRQDPLPHRVQQRGSQAGELQQEPHRQQRAARLHGRRSQQGLDHAYAAAPGDRRGP